MKPSNIKKIRVRRVLTAVTSIGEEFLKSTTLHGFKYFRNPLFTERLFWLVVHSLNVCCASLFCVVLCQRFLENPSILALQALKPDEAEPSPIVTLCPPDRMTLLVASNFVRKLTLPTRLNESYLINIVPQLAVVLNPSLITTQHQDLLLLDLVLSFNNLTYLDALTELAPSCDDFLYRCSWYEEEIPCDKLFVRVVSRIGVCCAFNRPIDHNLARINSNFSKKNYTLEEFTLNVILNVDNEAITSPSVDCAKVKIEDISMNAQKTEHRVIFPNNEYWIGVSKVQVNTANVDDSPAVSTCEKKNQTRPYAHHLCKVECMERIMIARCGCIGPTYPLLQDRQRCMPRQALCLQNILRTISEREVFNSNESCACTPTCDESHVYTNVDAMSLSARAFSLDPFYQGMTENMVVLRIYAQTYRSRLYSLVSTVSWPILLYSAPGLAVLMMLASQRAKHVDHGVYINKHRRNPSLGGVFNMFLGVGVVTMIEVFFYLMLRLPMKAVTSYRQAVLRRFAIARRINDNYRIYI